MPARISEQEKAWYLRIENIVQGPYSSTRVRQLLLNGNADLSHEISVDRDNWQQLRDISEVVPVNLRAKLGDQAALVLIQARQQAEPDALVAETRGFPVAASLVVVFLIVGVLGIAVRQDKPGQVEEPNCAAPAAPAVNWKNCFLSHKDVGAASLAGANLNSAIFRHAKLTATNLMESDLRYADLRGADLSYAQLNHARMQGANLRDCDLSQADLKAADLGYADLTGCRITGANLSVARLGGAIWIDGRTCSMDSVGRCLP